MPIRYWLGAAAALGMIALAFVGTWPAHAEPQTPPPVASTCVSAESVKARLAPLAEAVNSVAGEGAQVIADSISDQFKQPHVAVALVIAFVGGENAVVFGFDGRACGVIAGAMTLDVFNAARGAAGLAPIVHKPDKPLGIDI